MIPSWVLLTVLSQFFFTVSVFIDKYLVSGRFKDWKPIPIYTSLVNGVLGTVIWVALGFPIPPMHDLIIVLLTGALTIIGLATYYAAIFNEQATNIIIFFKMEPLMVLILSTLFLGELLTVQQLIGFVVILISGVAIALEGSLKNFRLSKGFYLIMLTNLFWALPSILFKYASQSTSFWKLANYESWGFFIGGLLLLVVKSMRDAFLLHVRSVSKSTIGVVATNEVVYLLARLINYYAMTIGIVALVSVLGSTQVIWGLLFGLVLGTLAPAIFKEDISKSGLTKKLVFTSTLIAGVLLVS
jgi:drug/metabolite transporter (DMT)-like permease